MSDERGTRPPLDETPMAHGRFGEPEDTDDLLDQYGTYNIQPTADREGVFPAIAQGLPKAWRGMEIAKEELERES